MQLSSKKMHANRVRKGITVWLLQVGGCKWLVERDLAYIANVLSTVACQSLANFNLDQLGIVR